MINLLAFCSNDLERYSIHKPFSRGLYTYATDGFIILRLPRQAEVPENSDAPDSGKIFSSVNAPGAPRGAAEFRPVALTELPHESWETCEECEGSGLEHDCPYCKCECPLCDGAGETVKNVSVLILGRPYALKYARLLLTLPCLEIAHLPSFAKASQDKLSEARGAKDDAKVMPLSFRFTGGDGLLMPLRRKLAAHIDIDLAPPSRFALRRASPAKLRMQRSRVARLSRMI